MLFLLPCRDYVAKTQEPFYNRFSHLVKIKSFLAFNISSRPYDDIIIIITIIIVILFITEWMLDGSIVHCWATLCADSTTAVWNE